MLRAVCGRSLCGGGVVCAPYNVQLQSRRRRRGDCLDLVRCDCYCDCVWMGRDGVMCDVFIRVFVLLLSLIVYCTDFIVLFGYAVSAARALVDKNLYIVVFI